jgi:diguanylate cyclase (GGDEF)-like protein/PAS domain S-box-containing protein
VIRRPVTALRDALWPMSVKTVWLWYLLGGSFVTYLYVVVPSFQRGSTLHGPLINALGLSGAIAIVAGVRMHRPRAVIAWSMMVVGQLLFVAGDFYTYSLTSLFGVHVGFPSPGDGLYLTVYPALMAGLLLLVRRRNPRPDRAGAIDSLILTLGIALLSWVFLIAPNIQLGGDWLPEAVSIAYPVGDILLLAAAIRLSVDRGVRAPAFYLLAGSIVCLLMTDSVYNRMLLDGSYHGQVILDVGWIFYYLLWGAAALHPSMRTLEQPVEDRTRLTPLRLTFLSVACLIAPGIRLYQEWGNTDVVVVVIASILMFMFVLVRMAGLVRQEERAVSRQRALRRAGVALVGAASMDQIEHAAADAVRELAGAGADARLVSFHGDATEGDEISPEVRSWLTGEAGDDGTPVRWVDMPADLLEQLGLAADTSHALLALAGRTAGSAFLILSIPGAYGAEMNGALEALAAQMSLAIDGALLAEDLHRRRSEARFRSLVAHSSDLIAVLDRSGTVVYQSPSIEEVLGYTADEVMNTRFDLLVRPSDRARLMQVVEGSDARIGGSGMIECSLRSRAGEWLQFEIRHTNLLDDEHVQGIVLNCRDISERKLFEDQLAHQAFHDPVTGLANRALFADRVQHALARAAREQSTVGVIFIDLDDFKTINDSLGHAAGDAVLQEVSHRMRAAVRPTDTVARFGGDEFAVLVEEVQRSQEAVDVAERVLEALNTPVDTGHKELFVGASVGLCLTNGDLVDAADLLRNADVAMYMAKRERKGSYRVFEPDMHREVVERLEMRADLQRAVDTGQLEVHYQPVIRLSGSTVYGFEALLRWHHPTHGTIPPTQFIPLAEDTGLIVPIGRWTLNQACQQAAELHAAYPMDPPLTISVNLSVKQLQSDTIVGDVREALTTSGVPASALVLEITESVMMADMDLAVARLHALKRLGIKLAMDDFGTGYSSLSYLSRLPVDILKMDRSFLASGDAVSGLPAAIVALGESLHLEVVAEGIEQATQASLLRDLGCDLGQGFLFAHAMNSPDLLRYLLALKKSAERPRRADAA